MKKKVFSLAMILCMALSMAACGNKAEELEKEVTAIMEEVVEIAKEEASVEEVPEETTDEETVVEDTVIEEKKEEIIEDAGSEEKETSENLSNENVIEETTKNLSEEKVVEVPVETPVEEKVVEVPVETPVEETVVEVPVETPVEDNKKDTVELPVSVPENSNIYYGPAEYSGNTITTDTGFVVPLLKEFNQIGANLDNDKYSWTGEWGDPTAEASLDKMLDTCDAFGIHHSGASADFLLANQNELHWYPWDADANPHLYLKKGGDHWKLVITSPILDYNTAQANGNWPGINEKNVEHAKDALVVLLSTITPDCVNVKDAILNFLYVGDNSRPTIPDDYSWTKIGTTNIKMSAYDLTNGKHVIVFNLK